MNAMPDHRSSVLVPKVVMRHVGKAFAGRTVLDDVDLTIGDGEFVALLGASGSGKTTILRTLLGLEVADRGQIGVPHIRTAVFQEPRLAPNLRVIDNVLVGLNRSRVNRENALAMLEEVGLGGHAQAWPGTLSGGEAQRAALARALVRKPELLLLDEPFAALDALTRIRMHGLLGVLCRRHNPAVLLVTHDVDEAVLLADRVIVLRDGRIAVDLPLVGSGHDERGSPQFVRTTRLLLSELGVKVDTAP